jgi:ABC-type polysaccharide/polyol phosphate export permease
MLKNTLFLITHDLSYLLRRREMLLWTFVMPVVFFYFIGSIAGGFARMDEPDPIAVSSSPDSGFLKDQLIQRLEQRHYSVIRNDNYFRQLRIPAHFTADVLAGRPVKLDFLRRGSGVYTDDDRLRINRAVNTVLADVVTLSSQGIALTPEAFADLAKRPRAITVDATTAGKRRIPPVGFEQAVPGIMVMFTMQVLLTVGGVSLSAERRGGILRRLASSPMSRASVVLGKWGARVLVGFIQILFAMATGTLLFKVHWGDHLGVILLLLAAYASFTAALGLLLGNVAHNEGQLIGIAVISSNVMAALGGCWWPIEIAPPFAQKLALFFPTGWAMDALHKLMSFGESPAAVIPHIAAFIALALIAGYTLARTFRFQ